MAVFPRMTIKRRGDTSLQIDPLQVDQLRCSVPHSGSTDGIVGTIQQWGVEYMKTYVYTNISDKNFNKNYTKSLFDLFLESQDQATILDFEFGYFKNDTPKRNALFTYEFKGWITQYIIIDPVSVMDLRRYISPDWDPKQEDRVGGFLPRMGSHMTVLRLELTGAVDEDNINYLRIKRDSM
jgi:hypothetical protein